MNRTQSSSVHKLYRIVRQAAMQLVSDNTWRDFVGLMDRGVCFDSKLQHF